MLKSIGQVVSILSKSFLLIQSAKSLEEGQQLVVFGEVEHTEIKAKCGLSGVIYPKGRIYVIVDQGNNLYLATTTLTEPTRKIVRIENDYSKMMASSLALSLSGLDPFPRATKEVIERVPKNFPAELDETQSLHLHLDQIIRNGDHIALAKAA